MYSKYLKTLVTGFAVTATALCCFNWFINPLGIFNSPSIHGINFMKDYMWKHDRAVKAWGIRTRHPNGLILGTSRSAVGLNTSHAGWQRADNIYNASLTASTSYELFRYLQHAYAFNHVDQIIFGLDFLAFNPARANPAGFDASLLKVDEYNNRAPGYPLLSEYRQLMSWSMAKTSLDTLEINRDPANQKFNADNYRQPFSPSGVMQPDNFKRPLWQTQRRQAFISVGELVRQWWAPVAGFNLGTDGAESKPLHWYRRILRLAYENDTETTLFFTPTHAYVYETLANVDLWQTWEDWKIRLIQINEEEALRAGKAAYSVYDFSGYNDITTEVIADQTGTEFAATNYWDPIHFKAEVGDQVQDIIFGLSDANKSFGVSVNSDNIEDHLRSIREARREYQTTHIDEVNELEAFLDGITSAE